MLHYILKRLGLALRVRWYWLVFPVLATGLYLTYAYVRVSGYRIQAEVRADVSALPTSAQERTRIFERMMKAMTLPSLQDPRLSSLLFNQLVHRPSVLGDLGIALGDKTTHANWRNAPVVRDFVHRLSVGMTDRGFMLRYVGRDQAKGHKVMQYLVAALASRLNRLAVHVQPTNPAPGSAKTAGMPPNTKRGLVFSVAPVQVDAKRYEVSSSEITIAIWVFFIFLLLTIIGLGVAEMFNRTLSSEKELAQYLDVPVLGTMPNVDHR